jgi:hypothetical protein
MHRQTSGGLHGHYQTMEYLQRLGPQHIELILEFSKWVINEDADDGFLIFTSDDFPEIAQLPQDQVLAHLQVGRRQGAAALLTLIVCCLVLFTTTHAHAHHCFIALLPLVACCLVSFTPPRTRSISLLRCWHHSIASLRCWHALSTDPVCSTNPVGL